jgi:hypothetical protein
MNRRSTEVPAPAEDRIIASVAAALGRAARFEEPYRHWIVNRLLPSDILSDLKALKFPVYNPGELSGKREYHNDTRHYIDTQNIAAHHCAAAIASAFQAPRMVRAIEAFFETVIDGTLLRIEYAQDVTGFWLEPHTDLGVKRLTMLIYLSDTNSHDGLGTDIYDAQKNCVKRAPFTDNSAMCFVPGGDTYHGFEPREIEGVRKSLILNYVTTDWRDREQLCFPDSLVRRD